MTTMTLSKSKRPIEIPQDFWGRVAISTDAEKCWEWQEGTYPKGYGKAWYKGQHQHASRLAWIMQHGDPGDQHVLHRCDNPPCCNPAHLYLGDARDNINDAYSRGRRDHSVLAKITEEDVAEIRKRLALGTESQDSIAEDYGISQTQVSRINTGKHWKHI